MRILNIEKTSFAPLAYLNAGRDKLPYRTYLPLLRGQVDTLPQELDALILTSDLQGREDAPADRLLGLVLVDHLLELAGRGDIADPQKTGVILAGDLFAVPGSTRRGGSGDVSEVWQALAEHFRWVTGVLGNHDEINRPLPDNAKVLDGEVMSRDGIKIAGLSGIIGNPHRKNRRTEQDFVKGIEDLAQKRPDLLVLHQGPDRRPQPNPAVESALAHARKLLVVCGHASWKEPLLNLPQEVQVVNVDAWVVVLSR